MEDDEGSETFESSETSETSETPDTDETSETPDTDETSETPDTDEMSETPDTAETSETPDTDERSETPETSATRAINEMFNGKTIWEVLKEQKSKSPSEALLERYPYIRKNPCIRRVIVAINELNYQIKKPSECKKKKCLFCKYHVEEMMNEKYNGQAALPVCEAVNVVFLLYCINCDELLLGYTCEKFERLADISFGFHRDENCEPGKSHEKRYVRCMMIDKLELTYGAKDVVPVSILIDTNQQSIMGRFITKIKKKFSVYVIKEYELEKGNVKCETPSKLITLEKYLQVKKYLVVKKCEGNESYLQEKSRFLSPPSIDVGTNWGIYRQYHYLPSSNVKQLGLKPNTYLFDSETIVYLKICYNCNIKYVGKADKTYLGRYPTVLYDPKKNSSVYKHFTGKKCNVRDLRWTVIDALSDDQMYLLEKWKYVFNRCELDVQKKIWKMMNCYVNSLKENLLKIVWENDSIDEIIERITEIKLNKETELNKAMEQFKLCLQNDTRNKELDRVLEHFNAANDDVETFLRSENEKWIKKTKALYLEEREDYWMTELETLENGLNVNKSSKCKDNCRHFYNEFFKRLSK